MTSTAEHGNGNSIQKGVIDWSVMDQFLLFRKPGGADPRLRIITIFLDSAPMLMDAIKTAIDSADGALLLKSAHSLKSSSMNVGASGLGSICAELELAGKTDSVAETQTLADRLEMEFAAVAAALNDALQQMDK